MQETFDSRFDVESTCYHYFYSLLRIMKNRTSLTLVISLLVCSLTAGAFAQSNPSEPKPEDSALGVSPGDVPAQEENANDQCPYKVVPGDKVYLQINNVKLRSDNLPLKPYFNVYGKNGDGDDWKKVSGTWSQDGNQICEKVAKPSDFEFYIENDYQDYKIDVHSKWFNGNQLVAEGTSFNAENLFQWADNLQDADQTYNLKISNGNTLELKKVRIQKNRYYFEIVKYNFEIIDNAYKKYLYEHYDIRLAASQEGSAAADQWLKYNKEEDKEYNSATESSPDYVEITQDRYDKTQREILFPCTENNKITFTFSVDNNTNTLDAIELTTDDVVKQLNECMQKYPDDYTQWVVKRVSKQNSEIELIFAGFDNPTEDSDVNTQENISVADDNPDSTVTPTDSEEAAPTEEPEESSRPYKVTNNDNVYLQISKVNLRSDNLPLKPFFQIYAKDGGEWKRVSDTWSQDGNQICKDVQKPSSFKFYIDKAYEDYKIDVHSKWFKDDNLPVAQGTPFNVEQLLKWTDHPYNRGRTFYLKISNGNVVGLKNVEIKQERYYYEIVSYEITSIDDNYKKYFYESYESWVETKQEDVVVNKHKYYKGDKTFKPAAQNAPDHAEMFLNNYEKNKREVLLSCAANKKVSFSFANDKGALDSIELSTNDIVKQLNDCMKKYPDDYTKWVVKGSSKQNSDIELCFGGIQRKYRPVRILIPKGNPIRSKTKYAKGDAPKFRFYIERDGQSVEWYQWGKKGWDISNDENDYFEIREGIPNKYSIRLYDHDTFWFTPQLHLTDFSEITDLDFKKGVVTEFVPKNRLGNTAATLYFELSESSEANKK